MKLTFTFIAACFFVCSVMGQIERTKIKEFGNIQQHRSNSSDFENLEGIRAEHHLLKALPFNQPKVSMLKSAQTVKQQLDSAVYEHLDATTGKMVISSMDQFVYNSNGNNTGYTELYWDESTNKWTGGYSKFDCSYDNNGNVILYIDYRWNKNSKLWYGTSKNQYTYDSNGNETLGIQYYWGTSTSKWDVYSKADYTYDSNGNKTQYYYRWDTSTSKWVGTDKQEYTYDSNGGEPQYVNYYWDSSTNKWVGSRKYEYTYDSNGNNTLEIYYNWNIITNIWDVSGKLRYEYTYDANKNNTLELRYSWDTSTNVWIAISKGIYTYDNYGNQTMYSDYNWNENRNIWVGTDKFEYSYNNNYSVDELFIPYSIHGDYFEFLNYMRIGKVHYDWNNASDKWEISGKSTYYYSRHEVTNTINVLNAEMKIYPNPVTDGFRINGLAGVSTIVLYDLNGKILFSKEVVNDDYVPTDALPLGIYLVKINTGNGSIVKKLVKK